MHEPRPTSSGGPYASLTSTTSAERFNPGGLSVPAPGRYAKQSRAPRGGTPAAPGAGATGDLAPRGPEEADTAGYTFYREGTPTPSDRSVETGWQKSRRVSARVSRRVGVVLSSVGFPAIERAESDAGAGAGARGPPGGGEDRDRDRDGERRKRVCGVPLGIFWCLVIGLGMVVIGLGVGLGLGLGLKSGDGAEAEV